MSRLQRTLAADFEYRGVGLHTGREARVRIRPAGENHGVVFQRTDAPGKPLIPAHVSNVIERPRQTAIGVGGVLVQTSEHLLASLAGLGVDNCLIEIDGDEVPGADGSAREFVELIGKAGLKDQTAERKVFKVKTPISVSVGDVSLVALPSRGEGLTISYTLDYADLKPQHVTFSLTPDIFVKEVSGARTFCLEKEAEALRASGLGKGANYQNTLVLGSGGVVQNTLRYDDECVRHKVLDLIGDLSLLGAAIDGHVVAVKSGHSTNVALARKMDESMRGRSFSVMNVEEIQRLLPHRYPFLLVDRIVELEPGKRALGVKNVTANEQFFQGHFPGRPIMPGVLQLEALAQVGGVQLLASIGGEGKLVVLLTIDEAKFRRNVVPGDQLLLEAVSIKIKERTGQVQGRAFVDGQLVCEAMMKFMIVDNPPRPQ